MKRIVFVLSIITLWLSASSAIATQDLDAEDLRFLLEREQFQLIQKYENDFMLLANSTDPDDQKALLEYAQRVKKIDLAADLHYRLALDTGSLEDALQWLILQTVIQEDSTAMQIKLALLCDSFVSQADSLVFAYYSGINEDIELDKLQDLSEYNDIIEANAKTYLDELSTLASPHEAMELIISFYEVYPNSKWHQAAYYYHLYHLSQLKDFTQMLRVIEEHKSKSPSHAYISALYLASPSNRRQQADAGSNIKLLNMANAALSTASLADSAIVLHDSYSPQTWANRVLLQKVKTHYYYELAKLKARASHDPFYGDEEELIGLYRKPNRKQLQLFDMIAQVSFASNDKGELAELYFWRSKINALYRRSKYQKQAIEDFGQCLIYGAPRKQYDTQAMAMITSILARMKINQSPEEYLRKIFDYDGIIFEDTHSFDDHRFTRVALADYDNDGLLDILFNGRKIYRNLGSFNFAAHPDTAMTLPASGGLWADFNRDGMLDFASLSHSSDGIGDALMKQNPDHSFVKVNAKAGDIDDQMPTEGAAFIDINQNGFPSLYMANYEIWQEQSGFPDFFWENDAGFFSDKSQERGFRIPTYTSDPGQAGRGVAPADFDNDGKQEILVTNYRLNRNFLFKQADSLFIDIAALYGVAGEYKNGYYGHSIGADWGDIDNDGDLDLIIANLAHPRFLDISDTTFLYRNDGLTHRVVGADTLYYWQFTDITELSGISYDELHAEPLFFDADNDGYLDLYISSVYENDRSYLYRNNGDGTFTDITFLAGARVYNGWSCAAGDLNRDGLIDLVLGSGNGTKILCNVTNTDNKSLYLKPVYDQGSTRLIPIQENIAEHPNSPAFGARVKLHLKDKAGREYSLIRELSSAKGSSTQNAPELHFGLGQSQILHYELFRP
ncbi:MAG: CRTAC1 family protein [Candidatus Cloacimonadaceae bacterium]|nr:CRTAC1 family protein [Candidatus Cloacimonadota bacterium]MCK9241765.1 CRTAC1 family protein [Candidatus Cloacimonadota bacterium]